MTKINNFKKKKNKIDLSRYATRKLNESAALDTQEQSDNFDTASYVKELSNVLQQRYQTSNFGFLKSLGAMFKGFEIQIRQDDSMNDYISISVKFAGEPSDDIDKAVSIEFIPGRTDSEYGILLDSESYNSVTSKICTILDSFFSERFGKYINFIYSDEFMEYLGQSMDEDYIREHTKDIIFCIISTFVNHAFLTPEEATQQKDCLADRQMNIIGIIRYVNGQIIIKEDK